MSRSIRTSIAVRSAAPIGAFLLVTGLLLFGGVVLVGAVVTTLGERGGPTSALLPLVGVLVTCAVAPTLARIVVVAAVERVETAYSRTADVTPDGWRSGSCETNERSHRRIRPGRRRSRDRRTGCTRRDR